jgi:hypothetical protein
MTAYRQGDKLYCCEACAKGQGCHHSNCHCGGKGTVADG